MKLRYIGPENRISHDGAWLARDQVIVVSPEDGRSLLRRYKTVFEEVSEELQPVLIGEALEEG